MSKLQDNFNELKDLQIEGLMRQRDAWRTLAIFNFFVTVFILIAFLLLI